MGIDLVRRAGKAVAVDIVLCMELLSSVLPAYSCNIAETLIGFVAAFQVKDECFFAECVDHF